MNFIPLKKAQITEARENSLYLELYSDDEKDLLKRLDKLFTEWHDVFRENENKSGFIIRDFSAKDMSFDGFYPGYLKQKTKLLFIGKEGRGLSGINYLDCLYEAIKNNYIGNKSLNRSEFHRRMLYLAYALQTGQIDYSKVPYADKISPEFGTEKLSFAFMNLSKFSNENESFKADYELINKSVEISTQKRNFIQEEIKILDPDIILAMNMPDYFHLFGDCKPLEFQASGNAVKPYELLIGDKSILLLDTYHFSYVKSDKEFFFDPIIETIRNFKEKFNLSNCLV